jgi:hypothetical protein
MPYSLALHTSSAHSAAGDTNCTTQHFDILIYPETIRIKQLGNFDCDTAYSSDIARLQE